MNIRKNKEHGNNCKVHGIFLEGHISSTDSQGVEDIDGSLSAGSGLQSVGCIKSVDLDQKKVEVVVVQGREIILSQTTPQIGQLVRLSTTYAGVGDARLGPLHPGQTGKIWHVENERLVLVQCRGSNAKWWYSSESLAIVSLASNGAEDKWEEHAPMTCRDVNPNGMMCRWNHTLLMTSKKQVYMRLYSSSFTHTHTHTNLCVLGSVFQQLWETSIYMQRLAEIQRRPLTGNKMYVDTNEPC